MKINKIKIIEICKEIILNTFITLAIIFGIKSIIFYNKTFFEAYSLGMPNNSAFTNFIIFTILAMLIKTIYNTYKIIINKNN